jgi:Do/DeqQ family serine protease
MKQVFLSGVAVFGLVAGAANYAPSSEAQSMRTSAMTVDNERGVLTMAPLLERTTPAVVNIRTTGTQSRSARSSEMEDMMRRFFGDNMPEMEEDDRGRMTSSVGSGVIIDGRQGYILTNAHVVDDADQIEILLKDRRTFDAELIGEDKQTDIAILKIEARNLTDLDFADSETVKVGDYVVAIGNPFGIGQTVTSGIVSALGRETFNRSNSYQNYIQTDAAINQGNSGGALINSKGELVGINTAILSRSGGSNGIGFAIPANMVKSVMRQLVDYGEVRRGRIGVGIQDITPTLRDAYDLTVSRGAIVTQVSENTPAEKAGIETGDVIVGFNGEEIVSASDIRNTVGLVEAGTRTDITFIRDGKRMTAKILVEAVDEDDVEIEETVRAEPASMDEEIFEGATITEIPSDMDLRGGDAGVLVSDVERGSRSWRGGLREGDVIRRIDRRDVETLDDFADLMERREGATAVEIQRDGTPLFLAIR